MATPAAIAQKGDAPASAPSGEQVAKAKAFEALPWRHDTSPLPLTDHATVTLPPHTMYLDPAGTKQFLKLTDNLPEDGNYTIAADDASWIAIVSFDDMGYVKDDEKIDPDALLTAMRTGQEEGNAERLKQNLTPLTLKGWAVVPHYEPSTHNLEFGTTLSSMGQDNVNYTMRLLGRRGVLDATLLTSPEDLQADLKAFRSAMTAVAFKPDETYAAYKDGDKVSEMGLAALVTGGVAAAALKGGLLKGLLVALAAFWKFIAVGVVALFAGIRSFFKRATGGGEDLGPPPADAG